MKCSKCKESAILESPSLCRKHFIEYFENTAKKTIRDYSLLSKTDRVCVAASGGKDSMSLLFVLKKLGYTVEALALDEGIKGYRDNTLKFLKKFCKDNKINLKIYSYQKEVGKTVDELSKKYSPACSVCGTFRRTLLDKYSKGYDKIATGHNLDDESQAVLMNILKAQKGIFARQGPITDKIEGFTQKVKPFYFLKEKEIMLYAVLNDLNTAFEECPYAHLSFRAHVRESLNEEEARNPGTKMNVVLHYLDLRKNFELEEGSLKKCAVCGSPCSSLICKACRYREEIKA